MIVLEASYLILNLKENRGQIKTKEEKTILLVLSHKGFFQKRAIPKLQEEFAMAFVEPLSPDASLWLLPRVFMRKSRPPIKSHI